MAVRILKVTAGVALITYGAGLGGHSYGVTEGQPYDENYPDGFAVVATTSSADVVVQDAISGDLIELPRHPGITTIRST